MIKNSAGQKVGAEMVSALDGSAFTGAVTVSVTIDAGTQATGSVGSGACTHEGNGYQTYAPSQAETNGDLVAFTFTGSGAVPQTVQIYTRAATPDVNLALWLGVAPLALSSQFVRASVGAIDNALITAAKFAANALDAVWSTAARTLTAATNITSTGGTTVPQTGDTFARVGAAGAGLTALGDTRVANLDATISSRATPAQVATELATYDAPTKAELDAATSALTAAIAALNNVSPSDVLTQINAALDAAVADSIPADGSRPSLRQAAYMQTQFLVERVVSGTTVTVKKPDGTTLFTLLLNNATIPTEITRAT